MATITRAVVITRWVKNFSDCSIFGLASIHYLLLQLLPSPSSVLPSSDDPDGASAKALFVEKLIEKSFGNNLSPPSSFADFLKTAVYAFIRNTTRTSPARETVLMKICKNFLTKCHILNLWLKESLFQK